MSFSGGRRWWTVLGLVGVVVALGVVGVVLTGEDHVYGEPVTSSTLEGFPTRGPLAEDGDLAEAAADVWRSGDRYRAETLPRGRIELLWAGKVASDSLDGLVTQSGTPDRVRVVVLRSGPEVATFADRQIEDDEELDSLGIAELPRREAELIGGPRKPGAGLRQLTGRARG